MECEFDTQLRLARKMNKEQDETIQRLLGKNLALQEDLAAKERLANDLYAQRDFYKGKYEQANTNWPKWAGDVQMKHRSEGASMIGALRALEQENQKLRETMNPCATCHIHSHLNDTETFLQGCQIDLNETKGKLKGAYEDNRNIRQVKTALAWRLFINSDLAERCPPECKMGHPEDGRRAGCGFAPKGGTPDCTTAICFDCWTTYLTPWPQRDEFKDIPAVIFDPMILWKHRKEEAAARKEKQ